MRKSLWLLLGSFFFISGCKAMVKSPFESDLSFLKENVNVVVLSDSNNRAKVAVVPAYQGRVMTSTVGGKDAPSFGWINREVMAKGFLSSEDIKGTLQEHIYVFGGEDRFWIGPEGGQFSVFFDPSEPFDFEHWNTPALIDTEEFNLVEKADDVVPIVVGGLNGYSSFHSLRHL